MAEIYITPARTLYLAREAKDKTDSVYQSADDWLRTAVQMYPDSTLEVLLPEVEKLRELKHPSQLISKYDEAMKLPEGEEYIVHPARKEFNIRREIELASLTETATVSKSANRSVELVQEPVVINMARRSLTPADAIGKGRP